MIANRESTPVVGGIFSTNDPRNPGIDPWVIGFLAVGTAMGLGLIGAVYGTVKLVKAVRKGKRRRAY